MIQVFEQFCEPHCIVCTLGTNYPWEEFLTSWVSDWNYWTAAQVNAYHSWPSKHYLPTGNVNICRFPIKHTIWNNQCIAAPKDSFCLVYSTHSRHGCGSPCGFKLICCHSTTLLHSFLHPESNFWPAVNLIKTCWVVVACAPVWLSFLFWTRTLFTVATYNLQTRWWSCKSRLHNYQILHTVHYFNAHYFHRTWNSIWD